MSPAGRRAPGLRGALARRRFAGLLTGLVALMLLQPLFQDVAGGRLALNAAAALLFAAALAATEPARPLQALGAGLALAWLAATAASAGGAALAASLVLALLLIRATFHALVRHARADADALAGAIFGYFLLALIWAKLYAGIEFAAPGAFAAPEGQPDGAAFLYFSLVTITTLGYGDILPVSPFARIAAGLEAATGTLYVAVLIGRIVGVFTPAASRLSVRAAERAERGD